MPILTTHRFLILSLGFLSALVFPSCGESPRSRDPKVQKTGTAAIHGHVVVRSGTAYTSLNPFTRRDTAQYNLLRNYLTPFLASENPDDNQPIPLLAESIPALSDDGKSVTWTLHSAARWHDGTSVTSRDVVFSFNMLRELGPLARVVLGELGELETVEAIDATSFVVKYKTPMAAAVETFGTRFPVAPAHVSPQDKDTFAAQTSIPGFGPYRLKAIAQEGVEFERVTPWWGDVRAGLEDRWKVERFTIRSIADRLQDLAQIRAGTIDLAAISSFDDFLSLKRDPSLSESFNFLSYHLPSWSFIGWNCADPLFADAAVRRAMSHLIRRQEINETHHDGLSRLPTGPFFMDSEYYDQTIKAPRFSVSKAKELLAAEGWSDTDGDGLLDKNGRKFSFTLLRPSQDVGWVRDITTYLPGDFAQAGIELILKPVAYEKLVNDDLPKHQFQAYLLLWRVDPFDPDVFDLFHSRESEGGQNWQNFKNDVVDRLLEDLRAERDKKRKRELSHELHRQIHDAQPLTFLFNTPTGVVAKKRLGQLKVHKLGIREWDIRIDP